ncbi:MAG: TPM domain-containing protein [Acidobacteriaceae bacterium]|jgi:uncharacterized protein
MLRIARWLMFVVVLGVVCPAMGGESVATLPAPTGYVNDFAGVLSPETRQSLEDLCTQVDQRAHAQIAVVTVKSMDADKSGAVPTIEEFSNALFQKWGVGQKKTDGGVLVIVSLSPRKYRIEVGYGLEGILPDGKVGDIGREMQPYLHSGDYDQAFMVGVRDIAQDIATDAGVTLDAGGNRQVAEPRYVSEPQQQGNPLPVMIFGVIAVVVIGILIATGHVGLLFFILFNLLGGGRGGGFGGGGFGGGDGGGGGGFGGFGGGGSGGGGASGDF